MLRFGSSCPQSSGSGASRMVHGVGQESSSRLQLDEYPLGKETGLPLIPCPDCGLARVIERRSANDKTSNYLRMFFKCLRNGFPKLCGFYKFQRQYLDKLKELGIVRIRTSLAVEIGEVVEGADATSRNTDRELKMEAKKDNAKEAKLQTKMEDLVWKVNMLMFAFVVLLGAVFMYLTVVAK